MSRFWWLYPYVMLPGLVIGDFNGPVDTTVKETANALLNSSFAGAATNFAAWSDEAGIFASGEKLVKTTGKYSNFGLDGDLANGQNNLRINNTEHEDEGTYSCQIGTDPVKSATLTVEAQVSSMTLTVNGESGSSVDVMAGEEQTLVCTAVGARPGVGIDWTNNGASVPGDTETESINGDTIDTISTLLYTPTRNDNGHQFRCVTTGQQAATPQSQSVMLNVQFAPVDVVVEYSETTITCSSVANPAVADNQYSITLNDNTFTGKTFSFDPERYGCTSVKCTATNVLGTATASGATTTGVAASTTVPDRVSSSTCVGAAFGTLFVGIVIGVAASVIVFLMRRHYRDKSAQKQETDAPITQPRDQESD